MERSIEKIQITSASINDVADFALITKAGWLQTYVNEVAGITREDILSRNWESVWHLVRRQLELAIGKWLGIIRYWVARKSNGKAVGFCSAVRKWSYGEIWRIYVLPDYQGKGIGQKLMKSALDWLGNRKEIRLDVVSYNARAIKFYEKFGFRENGLGHSSTLPTGKRLMRILMVKPPKLP